MKFEKSINEIKMAGMSIALDASANAGFNDDESSVRKASHAFFYDITNDTKSQLEDDMYNCIIGGPQHGNQVRFIVDAEDHRFIVFRPDCLHYKVAAKLGIKYPTNENVLYGEGWIKNPSTSMKIDDIEYTTLSEMPRNKEAKKFLEKLLGNGQKWSWADKFGEITEALFKSIMNQNYWTEYKKAHYADEMENDRTK